MTARVLSFPDPAGEPEPERGPGAARTEGRSANDLGEVTIARPFPRVPPGDYAAISESPIRRRHAYGREYAEARFTIFEGEIGGVILTRGVPGFFPLPAGRRPLAPSSKLARWIYLLAPGARRDRVPLRTLEHKAWRVRVEDVTKSHETDAEGRHRDLPAELVYSRVAAILERL